MVFLHHHHFPIVFPPPPPPPPHFYCFPSTTTTTATTTITVTTYFYCFPSTTTTAATILLFSSTTTTTTFPLFYSTTVNKRLQTTIISSVCRNVSSCQEQSWFSSTLSCLSSSSATVSFTDSQSTFRNKNGLNSFLFTQIIPRDKRKDLTNNIQEHFQQKQFMAVQRILVNRGFWTISCRCSFSSPCTRWLY